MISSMINNRTEHADWICPSDRHLSLRAKLKTGWSVRTLKPTGKCKNELLTRDELDQIRNVIKRAERLDIGEQKRVGNMVDSLENMKNKAMGDGRSRCILCAEQFGKIVGASHVVCAECKKRVCNKCSVPHVALNNRVGITRHQQKSRQRWICKICDESRELWKKSGAWFFQAIPKYILPSSPPPVVAHSVQSARFHSSRLSNKKRLSSRSSDVFPSNVAYTHRSVYRRRSNSSQSSDDDVTIPPHRRRRGDVSTVSSVSSSSRRKDSSRSSVTTPTSAKSYSEESPAGAHRSGPRGRLALTPRRSPSSAGNTLPSCKSIIEGDVINGIGDVTHRHRHPLPGDHPRRCSIAACSLIQRRKRLSSTTFSFFGVFFASSVFPKELFEMAAQR